MTAPSTLLVSRRTRRLGVDWMAACSWLGGAPRLGNIPWPRGKDGIPLHHVAQIDLADITARSRGANLPATGSLAFFIGGTGAVVCAGPYVQSPTHAPRRYAGTDRKRWIGELANQPRRAAFVPILAARHLGARYSADRFRRRRG